MTGYYRVIILAYPHLETAPGSYRGGLSITSPTPFNAVSWIAALQGRFGYGFGIHSRTSNHSFKRPFVFKHYHYHYHYHSCHKECRNRLPAGSNLNSSADDGLPNNSMMPLMGYLGNGSRSIKGCIMRFSSGFCSLLLLTMEWARESGCDSIVK